MNDGKDTYSLWRWDRKADRWHRVGVLRVERGSTAHRKHFPDKVNDYEAEDGTPMRAVREE